MSFAYDVKEEIVKHISNTRHCQIAELAAILVNVGQWQEDGTIRLLTDHEQVLRKLDSLVKKLYNVDMVWVQEICYDPVKGEVPIYSIDSPELVEKISASIKKKEIKEKKVSDVLLKNGCCKMAYLQGTFLCIGSMSDPEKSYHLEYVCSNEEQAKQVQELTRYADIEAKITQRKKYFVVYLKESAAIVEMLGILGAHKALMEMENFRILKEVRNSVNRVCNCDSANINKTINAAKKQSEDIIYLRDHYGFEKLPDNLREMALVRLEHPDTPLKELGEYLDPPVGKSGVNHRLRKLSEIAESHRLSGEV